MTQTIELQDKTIEKFSKSQLEKFVNSEDFEDLVLWYQMIHGTTGNSETYTDFKKSLWLS